jgi:hypothetical protein
MSDQINLKSRRKISLSSDRSDNRKNKKNSPSVPKCTLTIRVPETDREVLVKIELKLRELGMKRKIFDQDKWHVGLNLFNKLLDYVDKQDISKDPDMDDILIYIEQMIENRM